MKTTVLFSLLVLGFIPADSTAANFLISQATGIMTPTGRGGANSTYFGWEVFGSEGSGGPNLVDDPTPDIGTHFGSARIVTTNGEDHTPFAAPGAPANIYTFNGTLAEDVTVFTDGVVGLGGYTTLYIQGITAAFGAPPAFFSGAPSFSAINGVDAVYTSGLNANGLEQFIVRYDLPGNEASYTFSMTGTATHFSLDRLVVDTFYSPTSFHQDTFAAVPEPSRWGLVVMALTGGVLRRRRQGLRFDGSPCRVGGE